MWASKDLEKGNSGLMVGQVFDKEMGDVCSRHAEWIDSNVCQHNHSTLLGERL